MSDEPQRSDRDPGRIVVGGTGRVSVEPDVADLQTGRLGGPANGRHGSRRRR